MKVIVAKDKVIGGAKAFEIFSDGIKKVLKYLA